MVGFLSATENLILINLYDNTIIRKFIGHNEEIKNLEIYPD